MINLDSTESPDQLSDVQMSELVASSIPADEITEYQMQTWAAEQSVEVRPCPLVPINGGYCREFEVVLRTGVPCFHHERVQAVLRAEIYDDGSRDGVVELSLRVFSPNSG